MAEVNKIDSNSSGLRVCEEESLGVLPALASQVWHPKEPNSYSDFGGQIKTVARRPINASRQNQKGVTVDLDSGGGFNTDFTQTNLLRELRGFFFASVREPYDSQSYDNEASALTVAEDSDDTFRLSFGDDLESPKIVANSLLLSTGLATAANNGVNVVNSVTRALATGTLTLTPGAIVDDIVVIDGVYYQFDATVTAGSGTGLDPYVVDIGANDTQAFANLVKAINASGTPGTEYSSALVTAHPTVTAVSSNATTMVVNARSYGYAGNSIETSVIASGGSDGLAWGGTVLASGSAMIDVATSLTDETVADGHATGTLTFTAGAIADDVVEVGGVYYQFAADPTTGTPDGSAALPYLVDVGGSDTISLANLRKAINATGIAGTTYAAEVVRNTLVDATSSNATTLVVRARNGGTAGNDITSSVTATGGADGLAWGAATLSGGADTVARVQVVGYEFASGTLDVSMSFTLPRLVRASGAVNFTTLGLVPGQFVFLGDDGTNQSFVNAVNNGWVRVKSVAASYIELDKTTSTMVAETGTSLTVRVFFGKLLKNETASSGLIVRRTFQLERDLGQKDTAVAAHQGEYIIGALPNQLTLTVKQADKLTADLSFVGIDHETVTQADGLKSAIAPASSPNLVSEDAFNTSDDVSRLRMTLLDPTDANPSALFGYVTEFTVVINNNVKPSKAVAVLGAFDATAGQFDVTGKVTAYFSDVEAIQTVRDNADVTFDFVFARDNLGFVWDLPLISLGDARADVQQDAEIKIPLDMNAAEDRNFHHTLSYGTFNYLPDAAM